MKNRKIALIVLSVFMGVVWVVLLFAQLHLANRVFSNDKQLFHTKVDVAMTNAFDQLDYSTWNALDISTVSEHQAFEEYYPFIKLTPYFSHIVNARLDHIAHKPCLNSQDFDTLLINSVFIQALSEQKIFDEFVWGVYCTEAAKFVYVSYNADIVRMKSSGFSYSLWAYDPNNGFHDDILYIHFPGLAKNYSWDMSIGVILLFVLLAAILACFIEIFVLIIKESKARKMRSNLMNHIIHEFKTPITTISLTCQLLRDKSVPKDQETVDYYLSMVDGESKALQNLVEEVLMVFRSEKLPQRELREISVHEMLHSVVEVHRISLNECNAQVFFDLQAEMDEVMGDSVHLFNAFSNLVDNAIKYRNGNLVLQINTRNVNNNIEIRIIDNGIGIDAKDQKSIFEPFSRVNTDNASYVKGFGLGLSYVKYVADYHNGSIKVDSELGKGATFLLSLPVKNK